MRNPLVAERVSYVNFTAKQKAEKEDVQQNTAP